MAYMVYSVEDRLRMIIGDLILQRETLQVQLEEAQKRIADLEEKVESDD